jgi:endonuclease-3
MPRQKVKTSEVQRVLTRLLEQHGRPEETPRRPPLEQLVLGLLGEQTSERKAEQGLRRLRTDFVDFNEVRVTRPHEVAKAIQMVAEPHLKAWRIVRVLRQVFLRHGQVDLDFLSRLPLDQARGLLEQLDGVDARTVATVVLLSLGGNALPADAAVVRLSKRIGLVPRGWSAEQVQQALEEAVPPGDKSVFYRLMLVHGEKVCLVKTTRCAACALRHSCESSRVRPQRAASGKRPQRHRGPAAGQRRGTRGGLTTRRGK